MNTENRKLLNTSGMAGIIFAIVSTLAALISVAALLAFFLGSGKIRVMLIVVFALISLSAGFAAILSGRKSIRQWMSGDYQDGGKAGKGALISGSVNIFVIIMLLAGSLIQGEFSFTLGSAKENNSLEKNRSVEVLKAETQDMLIMIAGKAANFVSKLNEDSKKPTMERFLKKNRLSPVDSWGNSIVIEFAKKYDAEYGEEFLGWEVRVMSMGPDGIKSTGDDIRYDNKNTGKKRDG